MKRRMSRVLALLLAASLWGSSLPVRAELAEEDSQEVCALLASRGVENLEGLEQAWEILSLWEEAPQLEAAFTHLGWNAELVSGTLEGEEAAFCLVEWSGQWYVAWPDQDPVLLGQEEASGLGIVLKEKVLAEDSLFCRDPEEEACEEEEEAEESAPEPLADEPRKSEEVQPAVEQAQTEEPEAEKSEEPEAEKSEEEASEPAPVPEAQWVVLYNPVYQEKMRLEPGAPMPVPAGLETVGSLEGLATLFFHGVESQSDSLAFVYEGPVSDLEPAMAQALSNEWLRGWMRWNFVSASGTVQESEAGQVMRLELSYALSDKQQSQLTDVMRQWQEAGGYNLHLRSGFTKLKDELVRDQEGLLRTAGLEMEDSLLWAASWMGALAVEQFGTFADVLRAEKAGRSVPLLYVRVQDQGYVLSLEDENVPLLAGKKELETAGYVLWDVPEQLCDQRRETDFLTRQVFASVPVVTASSYADAAKKARQQLKEGNLSIRIKLAFSYGSNAANEVVKAIGERMEGDGMSGSYMYRLYGYSCSSPDQNVVTVTFKPFWYDAMAEDEKVMSAALDRFYKSANLKSLSDADKTRTIHDFILDAGTYPTSNVTAWMYQTPYGPWSSDPVHKGKLVCAGYAVLFYRMALDNGLDARYCEGSTLESLSSADHAWNLVRLDGLYYHLDLTWNDNAGGNKGAYTWYLLGSEAFGKDHFHEEFPGQTAVDPALISTANYACRSGHSYSASSKVRTVWKDKDTCMVYAVCDLCQLEQEWMKASVSNGKVSQTVVKAATCADSGQVTSSLQEIALAGKTVSASHTFALPALAHSVSTADAASFSWEGKSYRFCCSRCGWQKTGTGSVTTSQVSSATCTKDGVQKQVLTVSVTDDHGKAWAASTSRNVPVVRLGHDLKTSWSWSSSYTAQAVGKCARCGYKVSKNGTVSSQVTKQASCKKAGEKTYTAAAVILTDDLGKTWNVAASVKKVSVPASEHAFVKDVCSRCGLGRQAMYRLYNPNSGEHFYTKDANERNVLKKLGWSYEGIAWYAPVKSSVPVYRVYNPNNGDHHYTTNVNEYNHLGTVGWNKEGIGWYSDADQSESIFRLYNPNTTSAGAHHYTASKAENDWLQSLGWKAEGIGWHAVTT